jgi:hypothetical protein
MEQINQSNPVTWDFFLAFASANEAPARQLYESIDKKKHPVFFSAESIPGGDRWDEEIPKAQKSSLITLAFIGDADIVKHAHYLRDEIREAINMVRANSLTHKLIPVYMDGKTDSERDFLYGLGLFQGLDYYDFASMPALANKLQEIATAMKTQKALEGPVVKNTEHILLQYPIGPLVEGYQIPKGLIQAYAKLIPQSQARQIVSDANAFRIQADPTTQYIIPLENVVSPDKVPALDFWTDVFSYAGLQGPRMLAALTLTVPDDLFKEQVKRARKDFLEELKLHNL